MERPVDHLRRYNAFHTRYRQRSRARDHFPVRKIRFERIDLQAAESKGKGNYYRYLVVAVKGDTALAVSKSIHVATNGGKKGNFTGLKLSKKTADLKMKKKLKITSKPIRGRLKVSVHRKTSWESPDPKVATVNSKGRIKAFAKGTCCIYAYVQNGICKIVKVKVN